MAGRVFAIAVQLHSEQIFLVWVVNNEQPDMLFQKKKMLRPNSGNVFLL